MMRFFLLVFIFNFQDSNCCKKSLSRIRRSRRLSLAKNGPKTWNHRFGRSSGVFWEQGVNLMKQGTTNNTWIHWWQFSCMIKVTSWPWFVSTRFLRMPQRSWGWLQLRTGEQHFWLARFDWRALRQFGCINHWWPVLDVQGFREEVLGEEN